MPDARGPMFCVGLAARRSRAVDGVRSVMNLSQERLLGVIASLKSDGVDPEQRRQPRIGVRAAVLIAPCEDGEPGPAYVVRIQDISAGGVALQHYRDLPKGKQFIIDLPERYADADPTKITSLRLLCRVVHCRMAAEHQFVIVAQFVRVWMGGAASLDSARAAVL